MDNKCLVTNYGGVVNNDSLLHVGEFKIKQVKIDSPTSITQAILLNGNNIDVEIKGDAYFTDSTLSDNLGKKQTNVDGKTLYVSNNDCEIAVTNKYNITSIYFRETKSQWVSFASLSLNKTLLLEDLKYSPNLSVLRAAYIVGDLSNIKSNNITILDSASSTITGDISVLKDKTSLSYLSLGNSVTGDISVLKDKTSLSYLSLGNSVTGDISVLKDKTSLFYLSLGNSVTGDLASLANLSSLAQLYISYSKLTGDIASLSSCGKLSNAILPSGITGSVDSLRDNTVFNSIMFIGANITGDISVLANSLFTLTASKSCHFTWSHRDPSANIISLLPFTGSMVIDNVDKMLQDQAQCVVPSGVTKTISVTGTRTSASDDAVATLQSKGYTVSITRA